MYKSVQKSFIHYMTNFFKCKDEICVLLLRFLSFRQVAGPRAKFRSFLCRSFAENCTFPDQGTSVSLLLLGKTPSDRNKINRQLTVCDAFVSHQSHRFL